MNMQFNVDTGSRSDRDQSGDPLNILIVANFSGAKSGQSDENTRPHSGNMFNLDPYDVDDAIGRVKPKVTIQGAEESIHVQIDEIDDFHPDSLYRSLDIFAVVRDLKKALSDPATASNAARIASELTGIPLEAVDVAIPASPDPEQDMFSRLLGQSGGGSSATSESVKKLLADAVAGDTVPETPSAVTQMQSQLNNWDEDAMRDLLRNPDFRSVESAWRSVEWLGQQTESDEDVNFWLLDVADAVPGEWAEASKPAIRSALAGEPVSLIVVLSNFSSSSESLDGLAALGKLATESRCPVLAGGDHSLAGLTATTNSLFAVDASDVSTKQSDELLTFRSDISGSGLGIGFPRMLIRQPYGEKSDEIDAFAFEELESSPEHESFHWVSPAIGLASIWLAEFLGGATDSKIADLPMVTYNDDSGQAIKPPSEIYLSDSAAEAILANGVIPLIGRRGDTSLRAPRLQSFGKPSAGL